MRKTQDALLSRTVRLACFIEQSLSFNTADCMSVTDPDRRTWLGITGNQSIEFRDCATKSYQLQWAFITRTFRQGQELSNLQGAGKAGPDNAEQFTSWSGKTPSPFTTVPARSAGGHRPGSGYAGQSANHARPALALWAA
jgi:hypothetical protein